MATTPLPVLFTQHFVDSYEALPEVDVVAVDAMIDRLEATHGNPEMRDIVRVGTETLFVTSRIYAQTAIYRITWCYHDRDRPTVLTCVTVAEA